MLCCGDAGSTKIYPHNTPYASPVQVVLILMAVPLAFLNIEAIHLEKKQLHKMVKVKS